MNEIKRYDFDDPGDAMLFDNGEWCRWSDVEALIKERDSFRNKAFAAVWLLPEDVGVRELLQLREEAREVFMGKDKQVIAKLQDELRYAQEAYQHAVRPPRPGVNAVYGVDQRKNVSIALMLLSIQHAPNGGLEIEVQIP